MTRVLLVLSDESTRSLLTRELSVLFSQTPASADIDATDSWATARDYFLGPAREAGIEYHTVVVDSHLPVIGVGPDEFYRECTNTLLLHLGTFHDEAALDRKFNMHQVCPRVYLNEYRVQRPCYVALDRTKALVGDLLDRVVVQAMECHLDEVILPPALDSEPRPKGPRRVHPQAPSYFYAELFRIVTKFRRHFDEKLVHRLKHDFCIDCRTPLVMKSRGRPRMAFEPPRHFESIALNFLRQKEDCDPFALHYAKADGGEDSAYLHQVHDLELLAGYKSGLRAVAKAFSQGPFTRRSPLDVFPTDPGFGWSGDRRIHVLIANLEKYAHDAYCMPAEEHAPFLLLPHDWLSSNPTEARMRGFSLAVHEGTHAYNQVIIHGLWRANSVSEWEWFDEAMAIYVESVLFAQEFGSDSQLWVEHLRDWSRRSVCPLVSGRSSGEGDNRRFCGRGSQGAMFFRYLDRRPELGRVWLMSLWQVVADKIQRKEPVPPAVDVLVGEIEEKLGEGSFAELFVDYAMTSYAIHATEPSVAKKHGLFRKPRVEKACHRGQEAKIRISPLSPLACAYYVLKLSADISTLRLSCPEWPDGLHLQTAWVMPERALRVSTAFRGERLDLIELKPEQFEGDFVVTVVNTNPASRQAADTLIVTVVPE